MQRNAWALAVCVAALAACGPQGGGEKAGGGDASAPMGFPKPTASYVATYEINEDAGEAPRESVMYRNGAKQMRMEREMNGRKVAIVFDAVNARAVMFRTEPNAPKVAIVMPRGDDDKLFDTVLKYESEDEAKPTKVGTDTIAGLGCEVWEIADDAGEAPSQACLTRDGILLRSNAKGATKPDWIATKVTKGPQDAALFSVPAGYELVDMGPCMEMQKKAMADAQAGKRPDMAQMQECAKVGRKMAAVMGDGD